MAVYKAHHMGLGLLNRSFPLWDAGCWLYWTARHRAKAQVKGGLHPDFTFAYTGSSDNYTEFDPGRGAYVEQSPVFAPPIDGHFAPTRTNTYNTSDPADSGGSRGPFTLEAGMTLALVAPPPSPHILLPLPGPAAPTDAAFFGNLGTGSVKRAYRLSSSSATLNKMWSILAKRAGGGQITNSHMRLGVSALADPLGADIASGTTTYRRIRDDGWYQLSTVLPPQGGAPDVFYWFELEDNISAFVESPQSEGFSATIEEATAPILTDVSPDAGNREVFEIDMNGGYSLPRQGWFGATVIPRLDGGNAGGLSYPTSIILEWQVDGNNRHRFIVSNSSQALVYQVEEGGASQAFLNSDGSDLLQGEPRGIVATWGFRQGSFYSFMAQDGNFIDIDTVLDSDLPSGAATISIGSSPSSTANAANVQIQNVAVGNRALSRHDCRVLSRWFKLQAQANLGLTGV